jgi:biopolymer transport protein ExbD
MRDSKQLFEKLKKVAVLVPQPEVHIRADADTRYESVGRVVATCQRAAIMKIGFITEPPARSAAGG